MNDNPNPEFEQRKHNIAEIFGRASTIYDRVGPRAFSYFGRRLVKLAQIPEGANVLDIASGRGAVLFPAGERVGKNGRVTGIDLAQGMLHEVRREISEAMIPNIEVHQMDAEYLLFPDETFDCVTCGFAVFFFPQLDRALSEIRRVLKPNGRFAITTWSSVGGEQWKWYDDLVETYLPPSPAEPAESNGPVFNTPDGLREIVRSGNFSDIQILTETMEAVYQDEEEWWTALWSHGGRANLEEIEKVHGAEGLERFKTEVFEKLKDIKQADGIRTSFSVLFALAQKPSE